MTTPDTCPNCGHRSEPYTMAVREDAPGLVGILRGEAGPRVRIALTIGLCVLGTVIFAAVSRL